MSSDPLPVVIMLTVTDDITPGKNTLTLEAYERLQAEMARTGMALDEVLDDLIARVLPPAPAEGDDER